MYCLIEVYYISYNGSRGVADRRDQYRHKYFG